MPSVNVADLIAHGRKRIQLGGTHMTSIRLLIIGIAIVFHLGGCAIHSESSYLKSIEENIAKGAALIERWGVTPKKSLFSRGESAAVTAVDQEQIVFYPNIFQVIADPIAISPGRHAIEIKFWRRSWVCGSLGCLSFPQTTQSLELVAESGHYYQPQATKSCDKNWIWIEDKGEIARNWLEVKKGSAEYNPSTFESRKVVAGESPPVSCEEKTE